MVISLGIYPFFLVLTEKLWGSGFIHSALNKSLANKKKVVQLFPELSGNWSCVAKGDIQYSSSPYLLEPDSEEEAGNLTRFIHFQ